MSQTISIHHDIPVLQVGDLGIARVLEGSCDLAHTVIGTPFFMSPELFNNQPYSYKSDVWSLGCCVYEMASLKHAFSATSIHALMAQVVQGKVSTVLYWWASFRDVSFMSHALVGPVGCF